MAYDKARYIQYVKPWMEKNKERVKKYRKDADLKKKYGLSLVQYNQMLEDQGYVCKICKQSETQLHPIAQIPYNLSVDHCHKSGKIRALLCNNCNRVLGAVSDNIDLLRKLIAYLEIHGV